MIHADQVAISGRRGVLLEPTSLTLHTGERHLVTAEPGPSHSALALVLAGRMRPTSGRVTIDGAADEDALPVGTVVGEELALAGLPAGPRAVSSWLEGHGVPSRHVHFGELEPLTRTRVLAELAAARPQVRYLVLTLPERHGGDPAGWWDLAAELADRDHGVLVQTTTTTARVLAAGLTSNPHLELL